MECCTPVEFEVKLNMVQLTAHTVSWGNSLGEQIASVQNLLGTCPSVPQWFVPGSDYVRLFWILCG